MEWLKENCVSIAIVIALLTAIFFAVRSIIKEKGRCAYCQNRDSCPFANKRLLKK
ncbi:MAG: hypothetical protein IKE38_03305 [Erysipelotrichaceae bacterium]|nr:hypothetical protein [Erysipelotrichaceae bacterium]